MIPLPTIDALDAVTIPVSCPVSWDAMHGDNRTRFCDQCSQNVHDVSELSRAEAVMLLSGTDPSPCLCIYRREDGRVMTTDCTTKRERAWKWLHKRSRPAAALFGFMFFVGSTGCMMGARPTPKPSPESAVEEGAQGIIVGITAEAGKPTGFALVVDEAAQGIVEGIASETTTGQ